MSFLFGKSSLPTLSTPQAPPTTEVVTEEERKKVRQGMPGRTTLLTSPLGLTEPAGTRRKVLLGQ